MFKCWGQSKLFSGRNSPWTIADPRRDLSFYVAVKLQFWFVFAWKGLDVYRHHFHSDCSPLFRVCLCHFIGWSPLLISCNYEREREINVDGWPESSDHMHCYGWHAVSLLYFVAINQLLYHRGHIICQLGRNEKRSCVEKHKIYVVSASGSSSFDLRRLCHLRQPYITKRARKANTNTAKIITWFETCS